MCAAPLVTIESMQICQGSEQHGFWVDLPQWQLAQGERWLVSGESGCGKSTLLEVLGLLKSARAEQFSFYFNSQQSHIGQLWQQRMRNELAGLRARAIGFVLQTGGLLPFLTVRQNIYLPQKLLGAQAASDLSASFAQHASVTLGLKPLLDHKPHQLSIGERQRVAFVRAIAHQPALLLADEPTAALDPRNATRLLDLMLELQQQTQTCLVLVTHNPNLVNWPQLRQLTAQPWRDPALAHRAGSRFVT